MRISEQIFAGEKSYVIKVPETNSYNRYGPAEYELLTLCDGARTSPEVTAAWNERHPDEPLGESTVMEFLEGVEAGIWEQSAGERTWPSSSASETTAKAASINQASFT